MFDNPYVHTAAAAVGAVPGQALQLQPYHTGDALDNTYVPTAAAVAAAL
jgi:hypothetical protein